MPMKLKKKKEEELGSLPEKAFRIMIVKIFYHVPKS